MNRSFFSPSYILYKIQIVNKKYGINFNERETLQHYVTLSHIHTNTYYLAHILTTYYLARLINKLPNLPN